MKRNSLLLYAICAASLGSQPSLGAVNSAPNSNQISASPGGASDTLLDFLAGAGGTVNLGTFNDGLVSAFGSMSVAKAQSIPRFMADLQSLGVTSTICEAIKCALEDMVFSSELSAADKRSITDLLNKKPGTAADAIQLAQAAPDAGREPSDSRSIEKISYQT